MKYPLPSLPLDQLKFKQKTLDDGSLQFTFAFKLNDQAFEKVVVLSKDSIEKLNFDTGIMLLKHFLSCYNHTYNNLNNLYPVFDNEDEV